MIPHIIPRPASTVFLFPDLVGSLISVGQLCDAGLTVHFSTSEVSVRNAASVKVLSGYRAGSLYFLTPTDTLPEQPQLCNRVIRHISQAERVAFSIHSHLCYDVGI
jgi:hypothetical protein